MDAAKQTKHMHFIARGRAERLVWHIKNYLLASGLQRLILWWGLSENTHRFRDPYIVSRSEITSYK